MLHSQSCLRPVSCLGEDEKKPQKKFLPLPLPQFSSSGTLKAPFSSVKTALSCGGNQMPCLWNENFCSLPEWTRAAGVSSLFLLTTFQTLSLKLLP